MVVMNPPRASWTDERLDDLVKHVDTRFDAVDTRFDAVDKRFDAVDKRFDAVDKRFDDVMRMMQIGFGIVGGVMTAVLGLLGLIITKL